MDESHLQTFTMQDPNDPTKTISYTVNPDSQLDRARMLYDMESARVDCGYSSSYETGLYLTHLQMGVGEITISGSEWNGNTNEYVCSLTPYDPQ